MEGEMTTHSEHTPATVPLAKQAGNARSRWRWVEPCAWTVRMLAALEQGVKGDKWFGLYDKVFSERNLLAAFQRVATKDGAPGVDHVTVTEVERQLPEAIWELSDRLKARTYQPQAIRRVHIPKPGTTETRPLGIPTVRDRIVQAAVVNVIEPIFERDFAEQSYGFRPGRGCKEALRRVDQLVKQGYVYVVDADLKGYFDTIPQDRLMDRLKEKVSDGSLLSLIDSFLQANVLDGTDRWTPEAGAPQGAVLSPLLSNIYLDPLDHLLANAGYEMVRYADDFVILCRTAVAASEALAIVQRWVGENGLVLHPTKTKIADVRTDGFDFLGYHFQDQRHWPRKKSLDKLKDTLRAKTPRHSGQSLHCVIAQVNQTLVGWFGYFQHSRPWIFGRIDSWLRGRLRSLLRRHHRLRGMARGADHQRWPNRFFAEQGLFSLARAHASVVQSSRR
jgi:RNA-directed DNA polymerase